MKPSYNICKKAGSSLGRKTRDETRSKLRHAWLIRLFRNRIVVDTALFDFIFKTFENKIKKLEIIICKLKETLNKIKTKNVIKVPFKTRMKILYSTKVSQTVIVTDLFFGTSTIYLSATRAAIALNISNSTVMNKLNLTNVKPYTGRYLIKRYIVDKFPN